MLNSSLLFVWSPCHMVHDSSSSSTSEHTKSVVWTVMQMACVFHTRPYLFKHKSNSDRVQYCNDVPCRVKHKKKKELRLRASVVRRERRQEKSHRMTSSSTKPFFSLKFLRSATFGGYPSNQLAKAILWAKCMNAPE